MRRTKKPSKDPAQPRSAKPRRRWWLPLAAIVLAAAGVAGGYAFASPAPLGTPLPKLPEPLFKVLPRDQGKLISYNQRQLTEALLEFLAPQPDGVPPLRYSTSVEMADFTIKHFMGTQTTFLPTEEIMKTGLMVVGPIKFDQPVQELQYGFKERNEGETVGAYVARHRHELELKNVTFHPDTSALALDGYRFEHFDCDYPDPDTGKLESHFIFAGPLGQRVLVMDFQTSPELYETAPPWVWKIMRSFVAKPKLKEFVARMDPDVLELNKRDGGDVKQPVAAAGTTGQAEAAQPPQAAGSSDPAGQTK